MAPLPPTRSTSYEWETIVRVRSRVTGVLADTLEVTMSARQLLVSIWPITYELLLVLLWCRTIFPQAYACWRC